MLFTNFHRGNGGGHDTYVINLLAGLAASHEVTVAAPRTSRLFRLASGRAGVEVAAVDYAPRGLRWLRELWALWRLISLGRFDIVHVNGSADHKLVMLVRLVALRRPRIVYTKHNDHRSNSAGNWLRAWLGTHHVIAVSDYVARKLRTSPYSRVPVTTVSHGIDMDHFAAPRRQRPMRCGRDTSAPVRHARSSSVPRAPAMRRGGRTCWKLLRSCPPTCVAVYA